MKGDVEERDKVSERDGENEGEGGIKGERWKRQSMEERWKRECTCNSRPEYKCLLVCWR